MNRDIFVITAPSGTGKTNLINYLKEALEDLDICISHTTRAKRAGEEDKKDYFFVSEKEFHRVEKSGGGFIEKAIVYGNHYGVSRNELTRLLKQDKDILIELDWQGAKAIKEQFNNAVNIFILPPSLEQLEQRLRQRGTDSQDIITARAKIFKEEIAKRHHFDYLVVNEDFAQACRQLHAIITARRLKRQRQEIALKELITRLQ